MFERVSGEKIKKAIKDAGYTQEKIQKNYDKTINDKSMDYRQA
jgi:hypothetical protein